MESINNWFQDWSDACIYAKECAPDLSFLPGEPYTALAGIAAVCYLLWWWNEKPFRAQAALATTGAETTVATASLESLTAALDRARSLVPAALKKAA
jgi:hypothetical protein